MSCLRFETLMRISRVMSEYFIFYTYTLLALVNCKLDNTCCKMFYNRILSYFIETTKGNYKYKKNKGIAG